MKTELELKEVSQIGEHARQVLNDPLIKSTLQDMRQQLYDNLETSPWQASDEREEIHRMLHVIRDFEKRLKKSVDSGKIAAAAINTMNQG